MASKRRIFFEIFGAVLVLAACGTANNDGVERTVSAGETGAGGPTGSSQSESEGSGGEGEEDSSGGTPGFLVDCAWGRPLGVDKAEIVCVAASTGGDGGSEGTGLSLTAEGSWTKTDDNGNTVPLTSKSFDTDKGYVSFFSLSSAESLRGAMTFSLDGDEGKLDPLSKGLCGLEQESVQTCIEDDGSGMDCVSDYLVMKDGECSDISSVRDASASLDSAQPLVECLDITKSDVSTMMEDLSQITSGQDSGAVTGFLEENAGTPTCE